MHKYTLKLDDTDENYHNFIFETDDHRDLDATGDSPLDIEVDINKGVEIYLDPVTMKNWAFWKKPRGTHRRRRNTTLSIDLPFWAVDLTEVEDPKVIKFMMKRVYRKARKFDIHLVNITDKNTKKMKKTKVIIDPSVKSRGNPSFLLRTINRVFDFLYKALVRPFQRAFFN